MGTILGFVIVLAAVISIRNQMSREIQELREELWLQTDLVADQKNENAQLKELVENLVKLVSNIADEQDLAAAVSVLEVAAREQIPVEGDIPGLIHAPAPVVDDYRASTGPEDETVCGAPPLLLVDEVDEDGAEIFDEVDLSSDVVRPADPVNVIPESGIFKGLIESVTGTTKPISPGQGGIGRSFTSKVGRQTAGYEGSRPTFLRTDFLQKRQIFWTVYVKSSC